MEYPSFGAFDAPHQYVRLHIILPALAVADVWGDGIADPAADAIER